MKEMLSRRLVARFLFSERGLNIRTRIVLLRQMKQNNPNASDEDLKSGFSLTLPVNYGDRFLTTAGILTVVLGLVFVVAAPSTLVRSVLLIQSVFEGKLLFANYVLLVVQWLLFYFLVSCVSSAITIVIATLAYSRRLAKSR